LGTLVSENLTQRRSGPNEIAKKEKKKNIKKIGVHSSRISPSGWEGKKRVEARGATGQEK